MKKYYFTYGSEGHPFCGGWTEIEAPDMGVACAAFRGFHPDVTPGLLNCCAVYVEDHFKKTCMYENGNIGHGCYERITITHELLNN